MSNDKKRGHWIVPIVKQKCPACHKGDFFLHKHGYRTKEIGEVHDNCPNCGQRFKLEPGFFFGAAYVSYALNVALMVTCGVAVYVLVPDPEPHHFLIPIFGFTVLFLPGIFRLSRIIWATMFIPFGGEKKQMAQKDSSKKSE
jgi:hypothetical protein